MLCMYVRYVCIKVCVVNDIWTICMYTTCLYVSMYVASTSLGCTGRKAASCSSKGMSEWITNTRYLGWSWNLFLGTETSCTLLNQLLTYIHTYIHTLEMYVSTYIQTFIVRSSQLQKTSYEGTVCMYVS